MLKVSVVVPAYNEAKTVLTTLGRIREQNIANVEFEVIVIDDCSQDGTGDLLKANPDLYARLISRPQNGGKGAAVRDGLASATGDFVLFQDADLEYHPRDYAKLLRPVLEFGADVVMGSRMLAPEYVRVYYYWHKVGNRVITFAFNVLNNTTFSDIYSCYLMYRRSLLDPDELVSDGWEQHAEILARVWNRAEACYEVPVTYSGRTYTDGKKIRGVHAIGIIAMILRHRFGLLRQRRGVPIEPGADVRRPKDGVNLSG